METYDIIKDIQKLEEFVDWLPELKENEKFYIALFFRKKYAPIIRVDKCQLKRVLATKERIISKIRQMECVSGSYTLLDKRTGKDIPLPNEGLSIYISPNPRDLAEATRESLIEFARLITRPDSKFNPHSEVLSMVQKSCSRKIFLDFDFDGVDFFELRDKINECINEDAYEVIQTRGGFHLLVHTDKVSNEFKKHFYQKLTKIEGCDVRGDLLLPIVGCRQGDFIPRFLKKLEK